MFAKKRSGPTLIGPQTTFEGTLRAKGGLQVDGTIQGDVEVEGGMSVGPEGRVEGDVRADALAVAGEVTGTVDVTGHLHMLATGRVRGEVSYGTLQVDRGAMVDGRTAHHPSRAEQGSTDPTALPAEAEA